MKTPIYILFVSLCFAVNLQAQNYSSRKLAQLGELLPAACMPPSDSIFACAQITKGKSLVVQYNAKNEIEHLGVSMFSAESKEMINLPVCNFIERLMLELLLQKSTADVRDKLREYNIQLRKNGAEYGTLFFASLSLVLKEIQDPTQFILNRDSCYTAIWKFGLTETLNMSFPAARELIFGTDKKESDANIGELFAENDCQKPRVHNSPEQVSANELSAISGADLYLHKGTSFFTDKINSDTYLQRTDSVYKIAFTPEYPVESLANLFITKNIENLLTIKITHRMYGGFTPEFTIPLDRFLCQFDTDFLTYCVLYAPDAENLQLSVVLRNTSFNYIHLLRVQTTAEQVFRKNGTLNADFYTNIPLHNLKNIFSQ
ncbi:MAG: hypothetical protein LBD59_04510 [Prevotellaceae bacterium]|jgi:hypothetical protein|nr:hypothetical protein [Prevotellaceae bacterium]